MNLKTKLLVFFLTFSSMFLSAQHSEEHIKVTITIEGMACQEGCAETIAKNLKETEGIHTAKVSYETGEAIVEYDNGSISMNNLKKVITNTKVKNYVYKVNEVRINNENEK
ncbi:MAG: heavy-metal-associated domain-containing protein [Maribacter sp.]